MEEVKETIVEETDNKKIVKKKKKNKKLDLINEEDVVKIKKGWTGFWAEFKKFISKGNVLDMAIAVIIGAAFSKIVTSLVNDIITPVITWIFGKQSLSEFCITLRAGTETEKALTINYGTWIQNIIDFLIIAFCLFVVLKVFLKAQTGFRKLTRKEKKELKKAGEPVPTAVPVAPVAAKPTQEDLLCEIRDLLKVQGAVNSQIIINDSDKK